MELLPLFFKAKEKQVLVVGTSFEAARKIELLFRAGCSIKFLGPQAELEALALNGQLGEPSDSIESAIEAVSEANVEWSSLTLVVCASKDASENERFCHEADRRHLPVNVAGRPDLSSFVFPSIIDRSPVIAAVSSSGELPVLTRLLRSRLESSIPYAYGRMADIASSYKRKVKSLLSNTNERRRFWESQLEGSFAELVFSGKENDAKALLEGELRALEQKLEAGGELSVKGEVYLVGAGPGDPDLLTFKALRLMRQADIVLYDRLVSQDIMRLVRQDAELVNVGKERANHTVPQESINELLLQYALDGKRVLRLKGGDPFIFGRGGEEIDLLAKNNVPFQVVPGVTAAAGCGAYAGIPLTHRDYSQSVRFITGHLKNNTSNLPWPELVHEHQTLVFYMGLASLNHICESLIAHGMREEMPAALVSKGTTKDQKVVVGNISNLYALSQEKGIRAPTIVIVGEVVQLRERLNWRES